MNTIVYMIIPDTTAPFDLVSFHAYIQSLYNNGSIGAWWHYLPGGTYFFDSILNVNQLYNLFIQHMPNRKFIIMEVNPKNQQGWLILEAWNWFNIYKNK